MIYRRTCTRTPAEIFGRPGFPAGRPLGKREKKYGRRKNGLFARKLIRKLAENFRILRSKRVLAVEKAWNIFTGVEDKIQAKECFPENGFPGLRREIVGHSKFWNRDYYVHSPSLTRIAFILLESGSCFISLALRSTLSKKR